MAPILDTGSGPFFFGTVDDVADLSAAAAIGAACAGFSRDDDDECYVEDDASCFNCRGRRWAPGGFSCMRGELRA